MRRLALLVRHWQRPLMHFDPAQRASSSNPSKAAPAGTKRSFSQQAAALPDVPPSSSKAPRIDLSQRSPRRHPSPSPNTSHQQSSGMSSSRGQGSRGRGGGFQFKHQSSSSSGPSFSRSQKKKPQRRLPRLDGPLHNEEYIVQEHKKSPLPLKPLHESTPKSSLGNFSMMAAGKTPSYTFTEGYIVVDSGPTNIWRVTVTIPIEPSVIGVGDHPDKRQAEKLAALAGVYQLQEMGVLDNPKKLLPQTQDQTDIKLSDGSVVNYERARSFMDYYCRRYGFGRPDIEFAEVKKGKSPQTNWEAILSVGDKRIGMGSGTNKKSAQVACYLDVTQYLESCDPDLWKEFVTAVKDGTDLPMAPTVECRISENLAEDIRDLCYDSRRTQLYRNKPANVTQASGNRTSRPIHYRPYPKPSVSMLAGKSERLLQRLQEYHADPNLQQMRETRKALPVFTRAQDVLSHIDNDDVTICMAATGSGKTTQIPQMILDEYIKRGEGASCNIICTQPRRLAAISVADRVAKERGEKLGGSVGYQVRFEAKHPEPHGSITFCTIGIFLKRMQSALEGRDESLDDITHIVVDEVHERDVDTDLLLVVLKRLMADRKAKRKPLKVVLMSATIDPALFQNYFRDDKGQPAKVVEVPGRSFPVKKHYMDDFIPNLVKSRYSWVFGDESVAKYVVKELGQPTANSLGVYLPNSRSGSSPTKNEDLDLPYPLIAATISHVMESSSDGHVLVFCPGWDEIKAVERQLLEPMRPLALNFADSSKYSIHLLHSTIPLAEQQVIFDPPPSGVRRIILATNIAETSVTIPDVVYVVDTARVKELRFDPERHMSSLVSAWVGSSNLNQRAGRAGRHRPGEYFGILGQARSVALQPYQTVEMKRADLSNVVMHVKALDFPGMSVEEVLAAAIEPPDPERVTAAMKTLNMVGAIDANQHLTSLGRVLLQLPVEAQMGRLVLFGSFFRCLDQALTLAAIMTNREPFVSPMHLKIEAAAKKNSWSPDEFRSDVLAALRAYNAWWALQSTQQYAAANRFCSDNFLAKPTLLLINKIKTQLLQSLYHAGVIDVSAGGNVDGSHTSPRVPAELNVNSESLPLLAALIAIASQPKYAIRTGRTFRTSKEKNTMIHPSSVNHRKRDTPEDGQNTTEKQLYAYTEMRRNLTGGGSSQTYLVNTTKLDPMTYMLFGAYNLQVVNRGLECDNWLPILGERGSGSGALDDIQRLKTIMEACMLRVFEGITMSRRHRARQPLPALSREEESESEDEEGKSRDYSLSRQEVRELDQLTRSVVSILNRYSDERIATQSRHNSRPGTPMTSPMGSPMLHSMRLPSSGYSTPNYGSAFQSRPGTPSRLRKY
ncbi:P-loop containing nucleoside triphosphate hydrolase protein [Macrolepiota fuliginosa MF-IS2]|uniref:P-loop containing nucleoside triphosphate hydrolase protein n=1 Tax=Macrolepiota fuliginosa MF-IS2 TaxID=1400762 RepID=A0A9P6CA67_9AGAR|nr:P-loop containing nucleoside triphosphate hydrolase protein [Macrolepiota fuliginosa MF-IS2]